MAREASLRVVQSLNRTQAPRHPFPIAELPFPPSSTTPSIPPPPLPLEPSLFRRSPLLLSHRHTSIIGGTVAVSHDVLNWTYVGALGRKWPTLKLFAVRAGWTAPGGRRTPRHATPRHARHRHTLPGLVGSSGGGRVVGPRGRGAGGTPAPADWCCPHCAATPFMKVRWTRWKWDKKCLLSHPPPPTSRGATSPSPPTSPSLPLDTRTLSHYHSLTRQRREQRHQFFSHRCFLFFSPGRKTRCFSVYTGVWGGDAAVPPSSPPRSAPPPSSRAHHIAPLRMALVNLPQWLGPGQLIILHES